MTVGSLFSGIGGFDLGFERAGYEIAWQVEIDAYARKVLTRHWPNVVRYGDIRAIDWTTVKPVDVVCGGFPCQPHSVAGRRKASDDDRDLWPEVVRCLRTVKPRWFVGENVPGLLSSESGRFFGRVLRDLAACGFDVEWDCLPASAVGAPHRRDRVWIVAHAHRESTERCIDPCVAERSEAVAPSRTVEPRDASRSRTCPRASHVAHASRIGVERDGTAGVAVASIPSRQGVFGCDGAGSLASQWEPEPAVGRVAHGIPARVDRLRGLGNAIVPQIPEWLGRRIAAIEREVR